MNPISTTALKLQKVYKAFPGTLALRGLDLTVTTGTLYALLGPNGAGKTTALRILMGLENPDSGMVEINGVEFADRPALAKRQLAYMPDEPLLYPMLRPLEYLEFVAALWNMPATAASQHAEQLLRSLDLWERRGSFITTFSRGMKQKLALAGALVHAPTILVMDEPITGLDVGSARLVKDLMRDFVKQGNTIVFTTHIMELVETLGERIGIINTGKLVAEGSLRELSDRSGHEKMEDIFLSLVGNSR